MDAKCLGTGHENYFNADEDDMPARIRQVRNASKLCDTCPAYL